jgi:NADH-dependent peroxiredoxin subunit F
VELACLSEEKINMDKTYDLLIIGGGPAGMNAGIYAARQGIDALIVTKDFGGQIAKKTVEIENYLGFKKISGLGLIEKFKKHLEKFQVEIEYGSVKKIEKKGDLFNVKFEGKKIISKSVIIASGADPRPLEIPGEKKYIGKGVSYCTICDGSFYKGKTVAVIGGGNSGLESALFMSGVAEKIYILEYEDKLGADEIVKKRVFKKDNIEVICSALVKKIEGGNFVNSLSWEDRKTGEKKKMKIDGIFIDVGYQPATSFVSNLVDFSKNDEIKVDPFTCQTKTPGLFAAGDVTDVKYKQIIIAAGEGAKACLSACKYLNN